MAISVSKKSADTEVKTKEQQDRILILLRKTRQNKKTKRKGYTNYILLIYKSYII